MDALINDINAVSSNIPSAAAGNEAVARSQLNEIRRNRRSLEREQEEKVEADIVDKLVAKRLKDFNYTSPSVIDNNNIDNIGLLVQTLINPSLRYPKSLDSYQRTISSFF